MKQYSLKCYEGNHPRVLVSEDFVVKHNFILDRTQDEIFNRIKDNSGLGFCAEVLVSYLNWDKSKEFYKKEFITEVEEGKKPHPEIITDIYETVQDMLDYLIFGYMKALDKRGLSAGRTIEKLKNWLWLLGRDDLKQIVGDDELYNPYGMPALIALTEKLGLEVPEDIREFAKEKVLKK